MLKPKPKIKIDTHELRSWQREIVNFVSKPEADKRKIFWVVDPVGNTGKSWLCSHIYNTMNSVAILENGASKDIAHAYNGEKIVLFDFSRSCEERINYGIIESIKNGKIFSPKYNSSTKIFEECPHIVCFSNFEPDFNKFSADRWIIRRISKKPDVTKKRQE